VITVSFLLARSPLGMPPSWLNVLRCDRKPYSYWIRWNKLQDKYVDSYRRIRDQCDPKEKGKC